MWDFTFSSECINDGYFLVSFEDTSCRLAFIISEFCIPKAFFDEHYPRHMSRTSLPDTPESEVISHLQKKVERFLGGSLIRPTCKCWSPSHLSSHWRKGASRVSIQAGLTCRSKRHCVVVSASRVQHSADVLWYCITDGCSYKRRFFCNSRTSCFVVQASRRVHDLSQAASPTTQQHRRLLWTSLPRQNVRRAKHSQRSQRVPQRGLSTCQRWFSAVWHWKHFKLFPS